MRRVAILLLLGVACDHPTPPVVAKNQKDAFASTPKPTTTPTTPGLSASITQASPSKPDFELAVGEAMILEAAPVVGANNPSSDAIDYVAPIAGLLVVIARAPGDATFTLVKPPRAPAPVSFRVSSFCRDKPLNPALVLGIDERATIEVAGRLNGVEALFRTPWIAGVGHSETKVFVNGQTAGHATVMATTAEHKILLWDVFVGGVCAFQRYTPVVAAIPPGSLGPKGDGTCVRRGKSEVAAACPDLSHVQAASNETLSGLACDWAGSCGRMGDEGCCVGCTNPFSMKIERSCAIRLLRMRTCGEVQKAMDTAGCVK